MSIDSLFGFVMAVLIIILAIELVVAVATLVMELRKEAKRK